MVIVDRVAGMWTHLTHAHTAHSHVQALEGVTSDASGNVDVHMYNAKA